MRSTIITQWQGLSAMQTGLAVIQPKQVRAGLKELVDQVGADMHQKYRENLSGTGPSTASSPLPVGIVTGELLAAAVSRRIDDLTVEEANECDHAAPIEFGTRDMVARQPLADAVAKVEATIPGKGSFTLQKVLA